MADSDNQDGIASGFLGRDDEPRTRPAAIAAAVLTLVWLAVAGGLLVLGGGADVLVAAVAVAAPVGLIWLAALHLRTVRLWRAEAARLQAAIDGLRRAPASSAKAAPAPRPTAPAAAGVRAAVPPAASRLVPAPSDPQQALAFDTPAPSAPLVPDEFIRALNFPDDENDRAGFHVLRRALEDATAGRLVRASQDVLTLLSHEGIYTDDLKPDRARPEIWRRFAAGERGRAVAALGGVRDRASLALTASKMREDVIFRDAAHHFLRLFDRTVSEFVEQATDQEIVSLAETRTARAFMLLSRVTGTFD